MADPDSTPEAGSRSAAGNTVRDALAAIAGRAGAASVVSSKSFYTNAAVANLYVIEASKMAVERARSPEVRAFAQKMIEDHEDIGGKLGSFVGNMNQPHEVPQEVDRPHRILLDDLSGAAPEKFDDRYIFQQRAAHDNVLILFRAFSKRGGHEGLRNLAKLGLPTLEEHRDALEDVSEALQRRTE